MSGGRQAGRRGKVMRLSWITREMVRNNPNLYFLFGDNMEGRGYGGQAAAMRGEPNAIGVPTKWRPDRRETSYFTDADWRDKDVRCAIIAALMRAEAVLAQGHDVVIPADGLGTGLAELPQRAPSIDAYIRDSLAKLESGHV